MWNHLTDALFHFELSCSQEGSTGFPFCLMRHQLKEIHFCILLVLAASSLLLLICACYLAPSSLIPYMELKQARNFAEYNPTQILPLEKHCFANSHSQKHCFANSQEPNSERKMPFLKGIDLVINQSTFRALEGKVWHCLVRCFTACFIS